MADTLTGVIGIVLSVVVSVGVFLLLRNFWTWYFRINSIIEHLDVQVQQNTEMLALLRRMAPDEKPIEPTED